MPVGNTNGYFRKFFFKLIFKSIFRSSRKCKLLICCQGLLLMSVGLSIGLGLNCALRYGGGTDQIASEASPHARSATATASVTTSKVTELSNIRVRSAKPNSELPEHSQKTCGPCNLNGGGLGGSTQ